MRHSPVLRRVPSAAVLTLTGVLPLVLTLATAPPSSVAGDNSRPGGDWKSLWLSGTSSTTYTTSLADVRTIIGADTGPAATLTGRGVGIAMIDTGVAPVPGLPVAQISNGPDLSFESQAANLRYLDGYGHGTHIAGIIAADDTATGARGLAPAAQLTSIKVGTANGAVDVTQMIAAIDWVTQHRNDDPANPIRVLNLSYGSGGNPVAWTDPLQFAAEQAWKAGIVVVAAAGNQGNGYGRLTDPANDQWVVAVGAATTKGTTTTADDTFATYSNYDQSRAPDVLAPGDSITSLRVPGSNIDNTYPAARVGQTLFKGSGTSQAAAVTSAAAALLIQYRPSLTANQIKQYLVDGRVWLPSGSYGLGEVNVNSAIAKLLEKPDLNTQTWNWSSGTGTIEAARGTSHVVSDGVALTGENSIFGAFSPSAWAARSAANTAWVGGVWMGNRLAGDGWTGTSWTARTWAAGTWPGQSWAGATTWSDPAWIGRYWSGRYWSDGAWIGRYWSSDDWSAAFWG